MSLHDEVEAHFKREDRRIRRMAKPKRKYSSIDGLKPEDDYIPELWDEEQENK